MTIKKPLAKDGDSFSVFLPEDIHAVSSCFSDFEEIAEGTYCVVLKAKMQGRWYSVKALKPQIRESMQHKALLRKEYTLLATLHSLYEVKVYDFQDISGYGTCIVMEWIDGVTLKTYITPPSQSMPDRATPKGLS